MRLAKFEVLEGHDFRRLLLKLGCRLDLIQSYFFWWASSQGWLRPVLLCLARDSFLGSENVLYFLPEMENLLYWALLELSATSPLICFSSPPACPGGRRARSELSFVSAAVFLSPKRAFWVVECSLSLLTEVALVKTKLFSACAMGLEELTRCTSSLPEAQDSCEKRRGDPHLLKS